MIMEVIATGDLGSVVSRTETHVELLMLDGRIRTFKPVEVREYSVGR